MKFELRHHFQIESARSLPRLPAGHPCGRVHGHSFKLTVTLVGERDAKIGWVVDFNEITARMKPILEQIDHRLLNEVPGLENPTSENLCVWIYERAKPALPGLAKVTISETPATECSYPA